MVKIPTFYQWQQILLVVDAYSKFIKDQEEFLNDASKLKVLEGDQLFLVVMCPKILTLKIRFRDPFYPSLAFYPDNHHHFVELQITCSNYLGAISRVLAVGRQPGCGVIAAAEPAARLVVEPPHVEVPVVEGLEKNACCKQGPRQQWQGLRVPGRVAGHAEAPGYQKQSVLQSHHHVECQLLHNTSNQTISFITNHFSIGNKLNCFSQKVMQFY